MGLWYSSSNEHCSCCGCTCCCRCRPKQTTPAFVGAFALLGSAVILTLMLTNSMSAIYFTIPAIGFVTSFTLLCYVVGIHKHTITTAARLQTPAGQQALAQTASDSRRNVNETRIPTRVAGQHASASIPNVAAQMGVMRSTSAMLPAVDHNNQTPSGRQPLTNTGNTLVERGQSTSGSVTNLSRAAATSTSSERSDYSDNSLYVTQRRAITASSSLETNIPARRGNETRNSATLNTSSSEIGRSSDGTRHFQPTLDLRHGFASERADLNADAPNYFDVTFQRESSAVSGLHDNVATQATHPTLTRHHPELIESVSVDHPPAYDSLFPVRTVYLEEQDSSAL